MAITQATPQTHKCFYSGACKNFNKNNFKICAECKHNDRSKSKKHNGLKLK